MRNLLFTLTGFLVGAGMIAGIAVALPRTANVTVTQTSARAAMAMSMEGSRTSMSDSEPLHCSLSVP